MREGRRILAVVPARSGSKGIPEKNMQRLSGLTLIGWAGRVLAQLPWVDLRLLSTDSAAYAEEGRRHGLEAPWLRPAQLSTDAAGAVDTVSHALAESERETGERFGLIVIVEPTSPLRTPGDIDETVEALLRADADSAVTVSRVPEKFHPRKLLVRSENQLGFYDDAGRRVVARQELDPLWWRNGVCYAVTRDCLLQQRTLFGRRCLAVPTAHPVVNIDEPWELAWAASLVEQGVFAPPQAVEAG